MSKITYSITDINTLTFLYKHSWDSLANLRKRQWAITYYSLFLNLIILVLSQFFHADITFLELGILVSLSALISMGSILYLLFSQKEMVKIQLRIRRIHKNLPEDKYLVLEKPSLNFTHFSYHLFQVILPFVLILLVFGIIVCYIMIKYTF